MKSRMGVAALCAALLLGTMVAVTSPVGAAAGLNVNKIWKQIKPKADKRYYKKAKANKKFAKKSRVYTKYQTDAKYAEKDQSYTKAESDAKYAPYPKLIRGTTIQSATGGAGDVGGDSISFGVTLSATPTIHYIPIGGLLPPGCSGTPEAPNADAGHLCVFEAYALNVGTNGIFNLQGMTGATPTGAVMFAFSAAAGQMVVTTSWAVRPVAIATTAKVNAGKGVEGESVFKP